MADDTVEAARQDLIEDINAIASNEAISGSGVIESIDALIAAVRAEHPKLKAVTARCRDCGSFCDDIEFEYEQA